MKILVTGAAGFIGFHIVEKLVNSGNEVVGIDILNDYYDVNLKYDRLRESGIKMDSSSSGRLQSTTYPNYSFEKIDIADSKLLINVFEKEAFDVVVHMAAQAGVRYSIENPQAYVQSNLVGFANVLECCRQFGVKHLVYASSSSVYGMNNDVPFSEDANVDYPVSFYAATKKSNELMAHSYSHLFGLPTTGLRLFTVYGPWGRPDMAPMLFAKAIYAGNPIRVFNNGDMLRDFTYVGDIVEGISRVMGKLPNEKDGHPYYRIMNIGCSNPVNLMDFIHTLEKQIGIAANLDMQPMQPGDVKVTYADTSELQKYTDFKPSVSLEVGIGKFVSWYRNYYQNNF